MFNKLKFYAVYHKAKQDGEGDVKVVPQGFSLLGGVLTFLWLFYHRVWLHGVVVMALMVLIGVAVQQDMISFIVGDVLRLGMFALVGLSGNDWREISLAQKGYELVEVVSGHSVEEAEINFYKAHKQLFTSAA